MVTPVPPNEARFSLAEVAQACGVAAPSGSLADTITTGVCTDSRTVRPGALYVALRGERFDGHAFLEQAQAAGAAAALVEAGVSGPTGMPLIAVPDTLRALGDLAGFHRRRWGGRVVAITGSAGKTTTKELTAEALATVSDGGIGTVTRTVGNLNNLVGVPLTLFTLGDAHSTAVIEVGTSQRGEIARLAEIAAPNVGVVTSVAVAHAQGLGSLAGVAEEKASLLHALPASGVAIYSADHNMLRKHLPAVKARLLSFGTAPEAHVQLREQRVTVGEGGALAAVCRYRIPECERSQEVPLAMLGDGPAVDAAAALAVVYGLLGASATICAAAGLGRVRPAPGRLCPEAGPRGSVILNDTYNANPASMAASLRSLVAVARATGGRAWAVLGDMRELGEHAETEHVAVGVLCARYKLARFIGCGENMVAAVGAAHASGLAEAELVADPGGVAELVAGELRSGDVVLVKGSRSMGMEQVVAALAGTETKA